MDWWVILIIFAFVLVTIFIIYIYRFEPFNFSLNHIRINIAGKEGGSDRKKLFKILHLSDFHLRNTFKGRKLFEFIQSLKGEEYDFIFITGDMLEDMHNADYLVEMLTQLKARYGKYAVLGVHDHYQKAFYEFARNMFRRKISYNAVNDTSELEKKLKDSGIELLNNESRKLKIPETGFGQIEIIGLDDPVIEELDLESAFREIDPLKANEVIDNSNYRQVCRDVFGINKEEVHSLNNEGHLRMVLLHTPDSHIIATLAGKDTDIIFSGHTHGGQVRLPLLGALITGCRIKAKYASGLFYFKKLVLFISRGLGEGKYSQFRCLCSPEAVVISLYRVHKNVENFE